MAIPSETNLDLSSESEAHNLGANAVIGIDLDYQELNGKGGDMLMLVASGTAVILNQGQ